MKQILNIEEKTRNIIYKNQEEEEEETLYEIKFEFLFDSILMFEHVKKE